MPGRLWFHKEKQPQFVYEEIEKRQRQTGFREFMARRGVDWTPSVRAGNNSNSLRGKNAGTDTKKSIQIAGQIRNNLG